MFQIGTSLFVWDRYRGLMDNFYNVIQNLLKLLTPTNEKYTEKRYKTKQKRGLMADWTKSSHYLQNI